MQEKNSAQTSEYPNIAKAKRTLSLLKETQFQLQGILEERIGKVTDQWLLPIAVSNPRILEMFRERDLQPYANQMPWAGEFAGKHLTCAVQIYRLTGNPELRQHIVWFIEQLLALQDEDGYLGPWPKEWRLKQGAPNCAKPWDAWGHYHIMLGLLLWHELANDENALTGAIRIADLLCRRFLFGTERLHDTGEQEMNQAPVHSLAMLYNLTGETRYLELADKIVSEFELPPAGDYYRQGLANTPFHETPKPRWESLHPIMGLVELYYATGDASYRQAFENLWWSMLEGDRHNNGGFTSGERAKGNPYDMGPIETCCTVAWSAMSVEMLQLTGNSIAADELELSLFNSGLGMMSPSGRWVTYDTPMDGERRASAHHIVFQARAGSAELNCCSVNGPRMLGLLSEWALLTDRMGNIYVNYYGACTIKTRLVSGQLLCLSQDTDYPYQGTITMTLGLQEAETFPLFLRIPYWSENTSVAVNGEVLPAPRAGMYMVLERIWKARDVILLKLDMRPHSWVAPRPFSEPFQWMTYGPILRKSDEWDANQPAQLAMDPRPEDIETVPEYMGINGLQWKGNPITSSRLVMQQTNLSNPPSVVAVTEWISESESSFDIHYSASGWIKCWLNGRLIHSTFDRDKEGLVDPPYPNCLRIEAKKGKNILVVQLSGTAECGCRLYTDRSVDNNSGYIPKASIYRGPVLLAFDFALNNGTAAMQPGMDLENLQFEPAATERAWLTPKLLLRAKNTQGEDVVLCDFASAGLSGTRYLSWLPVRTLHPGETGFTRSNPLRSSRQGI